ncbi:XRE family transcriptional regulator [Paraburkholderia tropica]|uniref:XRE family transcriptional regulator n=1 Tax=Paraburkholderia tropica TaxID=92647 RepID=UPI002AB74870|nr:XRE family transcriptional regulator [Paraburkholderia tropica]
MDEQNISIRPECFLNAADWTPPTGTEIRTIIRQLGLTGTQTAALVGLTAHKRDAEGNDARTREGASRKVREWIAGSREIPYSVWAILACKAGYGEIWDAR